MLNSFIEPSNMLINFGARRAHQNPRVQLLTGSGRGAIAKCHPDKIHFYSMPTEHTTQPPPLFGSISDPTKGQGIRDTKAPEGQPSSLRDTLRMAKIQDL